MPRQVLIKIRRGTEAQLPVLDVGELGFCTDTNKLYIGTPNGNQLLVAAQSVGDMLKSIYDTDYDGKVDAAETADSVPWTGVTGKPSTFTPSSHKSTHAQGGSDPLSPSDIGAVNKTGDSMTGPLTVPSLIAKSRSRRPHHHQLGLMGSLPVSSTTTAILSLMERSSLIKGQAMHHASNFCNRGREMMEGRPIYTSVQQGMLRICSVRGGRYGEKTMTVLEADLTRICWTESTQRILCPKARSLGIN